MAFFKRQPKDNRPLDQLTPWERYQRQADANKQAEKKRHASWTGKPLRIGDKLPKLKLQRRQLVTKRATLLISLFLVGMLISGYFISPLSHVQTIQVTGTEKLTATEVQTATEIKPGTSLWAVIGHDTQISQRARKANQQIGAVKTKLIGLNQIKIQVHEIRIAGYLSTGNTYRRVLENGKIMTTTVAQPSGTYPMYAGFKSGQRLQTMIHQYAKLPAAVKHNISEIKFTPTNANPERVHLYMNDGNEVYATITTFASKMSYYAGIAAKMKQAGVVNLEVGAYSYSFKKSHN
ncbi:cell division protein FtsQ/DivIB [Lactiplantibacillus mudanjiangensis]|uniref:Cell division protein DivIB n=1 Tax=Lactiplantibacillus mudanjiangensis TaxID=1296538 RepID=A0A660E5J9_9LACO|nr:cell division protein FtsQ/DivIB [Lactiplantibacillus mudanjiangensis]VDG24462.1 cell division protein FtsQ [Lactobacillus sp.] [Lactiplantibacillus mudanjiangensis]VDG30066.1 cell division protein FtsQ [Lactobacillus sp.] [Lactiplantibacillus mudanjiangensis]